MVPDGNPWKMETTAIHEAGHVCAVLALPIREAIHHARIFEVNGKWFGDTTVDYAKVELPRDVLDRCDFAKSIAGPLIQLKLKRESVTEEVRGPVEKYGFLDGIWWIYENAPKTKMNWHTDIQTWINARRFQIPNWQRYYDVEKAVINWGDRGETIAQINETAKLLSAILVLDSITLLSIDLTKIPSLQITKDRK